MSNINQKLQFNFKIIIYNKIVKNIKHIKDYI